MADRIPKPGIYHKTSVSDLISGDLKTTLRFHRGCKLGAPTGRRLTEKTEVTDIVNFSPLCPTILSGPLKIFTF